MKSTVIILGLILSFNQAQAADSAKCVVSINGAQVSEKVVLHQDYDVNIEGQYFYRTYARDEFYELGYNYLTTSYPTSYKLVVELKGDMHTYTESAVGVDDGFVAVVDLVDHENHKIQVKCEIL